MIDSGVVNPPASFRPMTLPGRAADRQLLHRRQIDVQVFSRGDGLWEVEATLTDVRTHDVQLLTNLRRAGQPFHDLLLRLVVNAKLDVVQAGSQSTATPHPGHCEAHGDVYGRLVGLNLVQGFRAALRQRVGGVLGCTHLTELAQVLPTVVIQALAGSVLDTRGTAEGASKPFQLDRCHALRTDGAFVRLHYPRWARPAEGSTPPPVAEGTP